MTLDPNAIGAAVPIEVDGWRGLRDERIAEDAVAAAIACHLEGSGDVLKRDERSLVTAVAAGGLPEGMQGVVKEVRKTGIRRRLADAFRGAPARRAFQAGRGLIERGIGAALPLAAVERRRLGFPTRSLLLSLDLRAEPTAAVLLAGAPDQRKRVLTSLAELLLALHQSAATHGDLRAQHVHLSSGEGERLVAKLIDLESLRFRQTLDGAARLDDWAQMNGSIPDGLASTAERRAAFDHYASALPFTNSTQAAFEEMTRRSIRRGHLYSGGGAQSAGEA